MIVCHKSFNPNISKKYVDYIAEQEGYDRFIPYKFVTHLCYAFSFWAVTRNPHLCIIDNNEYTNAFGKLLDMIQFSRVSTYNPVSFAIRTLKTLYRRVDLRKLEASINNSDSFELNAQHVFQNYIFDGNSLSNLQLETIGITRENIDTMELPEDVVQILKFNNGMLNLKPSLIDEYSTVKETIRTYGDFHKVRR
jgi:hypothetical protein